MTNTETKQLCLDLAHAESESEVVKILKNVRLWDDENSWKDINESLGNWSTIGNQQSAPDTALVEKIINSVDAVMMRECLRRGTVPDSVEAPKSIAEAQKEYFGIHNGKLSNVNAKTRAALAEDVLLIATGGKSTPCYSIVDRGEGQSPSAFPNTFLSLNRGIKSKILFVQGKFGMGGTGVFRFGSPEHNVQLIISKRDPAIAGRFKSDDSEYWGFTVIRRKNATGQMRSSVFTYLAPGGNVPAFDAPSLPLLPGDYPEMYVKNLEHGTFIKIYEYELVGLKTNVLFDLYNRLSTLVPEIALPIRMIERRRGYRGHSFETTMAGLSVRLDEDKKENLEEGFPGSGELTVRGESMDYLIYVFRKGQREKYANKEGIIFSVNGQAHGFLPKSFFDKKAMKMSYLSDSILVIVNCSRISRRMQEDLFMNSRDRLADGSLRDEVEAKLEDIISNHPGLRALNMQRRKEEIESKLQDSKPLADVIENIIKKSPSLTQLFVQGLRIKNPFGDMINTKTKGKFIGKKFPSFFKLVKNYSKESPKRCPINRKFRLQFETDAENDYLKRDQDPGDFNLALNGTPAKESSINLWNGLATLSVEIPPSANIADKLQFTSKITDNSRIEPFVEEFYVLVEEPEKKSAGTTGKRKPDAGGDDDNVIRKEPSYLDLPNIVELRRTDGERWTRHFKEESDALAVKDGGEEGYDFFLNMDNVYLIAEMKSNAKIEPKLLEARYKYGMVLIGVSLLEYFQHKKKQDDKKEDASFPDQIYHLCKGISPVLLPIISSLGDLELE